MSDTTIRPVDSPNEIRAHERLRRLVWPAAGAVLLVGSALTVYGAHDTREVVIVIGLLVAVLATVYGWLIPSRLRMGRTATPALVLSILAVLLIVPAFWSALPLALGLGGALLGQAGRAESVGRARALTAVILGTIAAVGYLATYAAEAVGI